jgi:hypothetical protein
VDERVLGHLQVHEDSNSLTPPVEATVIASFVGGGAAIIAALINGLFNRWNARVAARSKQLGNAKPRVVVTLSRKTLHLSSTDHYVTPEELVDIELVEIRLEDS